MDRTCPKCGKVFQRPYLLKNHQKRKTPCDLIIDAANGNNACRYCGRSFATQISMYRHIRQTCKVANSEEGMATLMEHTLQRQLAEQSAQIAKLTTLVEKLTTDSALALTAPASMFHSVRTINHNTVNYTQINIKSWNSDERVIIPVAMLRAAFVENPRLAEYCRLSDEEKTNPEGAIPYVLEAMVDLVRRAHADPAARNVYLNPKRADQVMVFDESTWRIITLVEGIRGLFDSIAGGVRKIMVTGDECRQLPLSIQASASWIPSLYADEPTRYVDLARPLMSAHLSNNAPPTAALSGEGGRARVELNDE